MRTFALLHLRQIEGKVIEISQLQEIFSEKVLDQVIWHVCFPVLE